MKNKTETVKVWVARDKNEDIYLYNGQPDNDDGYFADVSGDFFALGCEDFPNIKNGECREAEIVLTGKVKG